MKFGKLTPVDKARDEIEDIDKYIYDTEKRLMWEQAQLQHYRIRKDHLITNYPTASASIVRIRQEKS